MGNVGSNFETGEAADSFAENQEGITDRTTFQSMRDILEAIDSLAREGAIGDARLTMLIAQLSPAQNLNFIVKAIGSVDNETFGERVEKGRNIFKSVQGEIDNGIGETIALAILGVLIQHMVRDLQVSEGGTDQVSKSYTDQLRQLINEMEIYFIKGVDN